MTEKTEYILIVIGSLLVIWILYMGFFPHKKECCIQSINWERTIYIEDLVTYYEEDWNLPYGARLIKSKRERHHYDDNDEKWIYKTRYYYEIDRWTTVRKFYASGNDKECYWNEDYTLNGNERDITRKENYNIVFGDGKDTYSENVNYEDYININLKERYIVIASNWGIVYSTQIID